MAIEVRQTNEPKPTKMNPTFTLVCRTRVPQKEKIAAVEEIKEIRAPGIAIDFGCT